MKSASPKPALPRVTLPWAQQIWDTPVKPDQRHALLHAFPAPTLDPNDHSDCAPKHVVSLAVVLDLLATRLRPLPAGPPILAQAVDIAIAVGLLGGAGRDAVCARLLTLSQSHTADARAIFVTAFASAMVDVLDATLPDLPLARTAQVTTPQAVGQAIARINQATQLIVREAELLLAQRRARSTWQI